MNSMVETLSAGSEMTQLARLAGTSPTKAGVVDVPSRRKTRAVPEPARPEKATSCAVNERLMATMTQRSVRVENRLT